MMLLPRKGLGFIMMLLPKKGLGFIMHKTF